MQIVWLHGLNRHIIDFAILSKRNIYVFEWDKSNKNYIFIREISNGELSISCLFYNQYLCDDQI